MEVELRSCQSTCLVSFLIRLARKAFCSEKLDQQIYEKLWTPAVFAASASFCSWNSSSLWLPVLLLCTPLKLTRLWALGPVVTPLDIRTDLQRCVTDALKFWPFFSDPENYLAFPFFGIGIKTDLFPVLWPLLSFPNLLTYRVQHFNTIIF